LLSRRDVGGNVRCNALMTPVVTVGSAFGIKLPKGFPMATTHCPVRSASESPSAAQGSLGASILITARG